MKKLTNPLLEGFPEYTPGEQPGAGRFIKLNTNENPYPPSPKVARALKNCPVAHLRLYPNPVSAPLKKKLALRYGFSEREIFVGNGSDDILRLAFLAFSGSGERIVFPEPSYPLYPTLAVLAGARPTPVPLGREYALPGRFISSYRNSLKVIANPNSPTGTFFSTCEVEMVVKANHRVVIVDEAYVDFATENSLALVRKYEHILVTRTMSKSFSLAGIRLGYCFGHPRLVEALHALKDSYNVSRLSQEAGCAALDDFPHMRRNRARIIRTRERLAGQLRQFGFRVFPSQANFLFVKPPGLTAGDYYRKLKERGILVRFFSAPALAPYLRISIGTDPEIAALLKVIKEIVTNKGRVK